MNPDQAPVNNCRASATINRTATSLIKNSFRGVLIFPLNSSLTIMETGTSNNQTDRQTGGGGAGTRTGGGHNAQPKGSRLHRKY